MFHFINPFGKNTCKQLLKLLENRCQTMPKNMKLLLLLGAIATRWSIWLNLKKNVTPMQVIFLVTHWLRSSGSVSAAKKKRKRKTLIKRV